MGYARTRRRYALRQSDPSCRARLRNYAKRLAIPTLALRDNLAFNRRELWRKLFEDLYSRAPELPCFPHNLLLTMPFKRKVVERFGDIRLDEIVKRFEGSSESGSARDQRVYEGIMDALGFSQNREPFRALATTVPIEILREVGRKFPSASLPVWEALFFGMAGLLPVPSAAFDLETNEYLIELRAEFETLQLATNLVPELAEGDWAHFRIRPLNTPYRRLALAALLAYAYFTKEEIEVLIQDGPIVEVGMSPYWERHTSFGNALESQQSLLGEERLEAILLNVLIPARISALDSLADRGIQRSHAAEKAKELRREWGDARTKSSANYLKVVEAELLESERVICVRSEQGTLFLKRNFCDRGRCSECPIGERLMAKGWKPLV